MTVRGAEISFTCGAFVSSNHWGLQRKGWTPPEFHRRCSLD